MEVKQLFALGNLYEGDPYGVATVDHFDNRELHGPFASENEADRYMHTMTAGFSGYASLTVVKIETRQVGRRIVSAPVDGYEYAV